MIDKNLLYNDILFNKIKRSSYILNIDKRIVCIVYSNSRQYTSIMLGTRSRASIAKIRITHDHNLTSQAARPTRSTSYSSSSRS